MGLGFSTNMTQISDAVAIMEYTELDLAERKMATMWYSPTKTSVVESYLEMAL